MSPKLISLINTVKSVLCLMCAILLSQCTSQIPQEKVAMTPPMGWNSYDCFGASVTEAEVKANADMMATHLKEYGWEYVVIDYCWFYPYSGAMGNPPQSGGFKPELAMDRFGRLMPAPDKFPSAAKGKGFKPLAGYVHSKGLKFGIHAMRGIPRQAVAMNTPVMKSELHARDVYNPESTCSWLNSMYGVDCTKKGAQEYYSSLINLYAGWGVDYIKVDDISMPYSDMEIDAIRNAIDRCRRPIVLSLSPGATPIEKADHVKRNANLWRISNDFWDDWNALKKQFERCNIWSSHIGEGHWPDADMLPIGVLNRRGPMPGLERMTNFTETEQQTLMTLWCIFRSPLMIGGDLTMITPELKRLLSNREVLEVNQNCMNNHQLSKNGNSVVWIAEVPESKDKYLALFNIGDEPAHVEINLAEAGITSECIARDLWKNNDLGTFTSTFGRKINPHGSGMYRLSPK